MILILALSIIVLLISKGFSPQLRFWTICGMLTGVVAALL
jgi:hypothetical protein